MIKYNPKSFYELILKNKKELLDFLEDKFEKDDLNITICGTHGTCKTQVCNLILNKFIQKHPNIEKDKIVFTYNSYDDINLNNQNILNIFCQNNINSNKLVYIENFDELNDSNQQQIKIYMDKYNVFKQNYKVFFLIKTKNKYNLKDIIRSRTNIFHLETFTKVEYRKIIDNLLEKNKIKLHEKSIEYILNIKNINVEFINGLIMKIILLDVENCDLNTIKKITTLIDYNNFENYIENIKQKNYKCACKILHQLYIDGYDLSDIYFYFYNYLKNKIENEEKSEDYYYKIIEKLCFYINEIYNGNFDKFVINLFTFDLYEIIHPNLDSSSLLV